MQFCARPERSAPGFRVLGHEMNNRRSFLKMLGLGAVAAPAAVQALQVEAVPTSAVAINAKYRDDERYGHAHDLLAAQHEINRRHSAMIEMDGYGERLWVNWAKKTVARG